MTNRTQASGPTPVDFPSHDPADPDYTVNLRAVPTPDPNDVGKLVVTFQLIDAEWDDSRLPYPANSKYLYVTDDGVTLFNLYLDEGSHYVFVEKGVTLSSDTPAGDIYYYFCPQMISSKQISFMAQDIEDGCVHVDPILLFIKNTRHPQLSTKPTDPDILNPGNHPPTLTSG